MWTIKQGIAMFLMVERSFFFCWFSKKLLKMFTVFKLHAPKAKFALVEMSSKRQEKVSFLNIHPNRINERFSFHFVSSRFVSFHFTSFFCPAYADKSGYFSPFSLHCLCSSASYLYTLRLRLFYWSTLKTANDLPIFASYYTLLCICYCFTHMIV